MPPKAKFTRDEIIEAALEITRAEGLGALTARTLGARLGSSARPIFTVFQSMGQVQQAVVSAARQLYGSYVHKGLSQVETPAFKGVGLQYIRFAQSEPKLFQALFMAEQAQRPTVTKVLPVIDENYPQIRSSVQQCYSLSQLQAENLYRHLWVYTHGIAVLYATNVCTFTAEELGNMLTEVCVALLNEMKKGTQE